MNKFKFKYEPPKMKCKDCPMYKVTEFDGGGVYIQKARICTMKGYLILSEQVKPDCRLDVVLNDKQEYCDLAEYVRNH